MRGSGVFRFANDANLPVGGFFHHSGVHTLLFPSWRVAYKIREGSGFSFFCLKKHRHTIGFRLDQASFQGRQVYVFQVYGCRFDPLLLYTACGYYLYS